MFKLKSRHMFILAAILIVIFLAGCGRKECEKDAECPTQKCFAASCVQNECVQEPRANCCGNGIKDNNENECSCPEDYGECEGEQGSYLEKFCRSAKDECAFDVKDDKISRATVLHTKDLAGFSISVKAAYDKPFNVDRSVFNAEIELLSKKDSIISPKITKIELIGKQKSQSSILGSYEIKRDLWANGFKFEAPINVQYGLSDKEEKTDIYLQISYEYKEKVGAEIKTKSGFYEKLVESRAVLLDPDKKLSCNPRVDCDDFNECTIDSCADNTALCSHETISSCCGNFVCEEGEDKAGCASDCGPCEGPISQNLQYRLSGDKCLVERANSQQQIKTATKTLTFFTIGLKTTYTVPFDVTVDNLDVEFSLDNFDANSVQLPLKITKIQALHRDLLLGETSQNVMLSSKGDTKKITVPILYDVQGFEEESDITLKIDYTYSQIKSADVLEQKSGSFTADVAQKVTFVKTSDKNE